MNKKILAAVVAAGIIVIANVALFIYSLFNGQSVPVLPWLLRILLMAAMGWGYFEEAKSREKKTWDVLIIIIVVISALFCFILAILDLIRWLTK